MKKRSKEKRIKVHRNNSNIATLDIEDYDNEVYSVAMCDKRGFSHYRDLKSWFINGLTYKRKNAKKFRYDNYVFFVYNLSYDLSHILIFLIREYGFRDASLREKQDPKHFKLQTGEFTTISTASFKFLTATIRINPFLTVQLKDAQRLFNLGSYKSFIRNTLKIELSKGDLDHDKPHYSDTVLTEDEMKYIREDVVPFYEALMIFLPRRLNFLTNSSWGMQELLTSTYEDKVTDEAYINEEYRKNYPQLSNEENTFIRSALNGGISFTSHKLYKSFKSYVFKNDYKSAYPGTHQKPQPYGRPIWHGYEYNRLLEGINKGQFCTFAHYRIRYDDTLFPFLIQLNKYVEQVDSEIYIYDNADYDVIDMIYKCYTNVRLDLIEIYYFKTKMTDFMDPVLKWFIGKETAEDDDLRSNFKVLLNSASFGKFAESSHNDVYVYSEDSSGAVISTLIKNPTESEDVASKNAYIPLGVSIPAIQRLRLATACYEIGFDNVYQGDTDSFMTLDIRNVKYGTGLGDLTMEAIYLTFIGLVSKRYGGILLDVKYLMKTPNAKIKIEDLVYSHYVMAGFKLPDDEISIYDIDDTNFRYMVKTARMMFNGYQVLNIEKATNLNEIATNYQMSRKIHNENIPITRGYYQFLNDIKTQLYYSDFGVKLYQRLKDLLKIKRFNILFTERVNILADASKMYARYKKDYERIDKEIIL